MSQINNILIEFIEIYINQVIYLRGIYPRQIFRKHKAYALPVFSSIYPPLNDYLKSSLKTIQHLLQTKELKKIEISIYNEENNQESFMIDILNEFSINESDKYLLSIHDNFRECIYNLEAKCKLLKRFSRAAKFKILLHTTEKAYRRLYSDSQHQDFLWMKKEENEATMNSKKDREILPISSPSSTYNFMSLYIEQNSK